MRLTAFVYRWQLLRYVGMTIGCLIAASSINLFVVPTHLLTGGLAGVSLVVYYISEFPIGVQTFLYNIPLLIASYKLLGKNYTIDVVIGTIIFSVCLDVMKFLNAYALVDDSLLSAIYGGVFNGLGYGIVFRMNGSTGGYDIIGAIIKKFYSMNMGSVIFAFNCLTVIAGGILFGAKLAMLTLICMFLNSQVTDRIIAGINQSKAVLIISAKSKEIANAIMQEIGRGVTFLHGEGAFSGVESEVAMVVVSLTQLGKLKVIANTIDSKAFLVIMSASEVVGRGFTLPSRTMTMPNADKNSPELEEKVRDALKN